MRHSYPTGNLDAHWLSVIHILQWKWFRTGNTRQSTDTPASKNSKTSISNVMNSGYMNEPRT